MATQCKGVFFSRSSSNGWEYSNEQNKVLDLFRRKYDSKLSKYRGYVRLQQRNKKKKKKIYWLRKFLAVQCLGLYTLTAEGLGSVPGQGTKIPQTAQGSQKKKKKRERERETKQNGYWLREMEIRKGITVLFWVVKRRPHRYGDLTFVL